MRSLARARQKRRMNVLRGETIFCVTGRLSPPRSRTAPDVILIQGDGAAEAFACLVAGTARND